MQPATCEFLGIRFDNLAVDDVVHELLDRPRGAHFSYLVTPNADHLIRLARQPELSQLYQAALLCVLDSQFLARSAAWLGLAAPKVATGSDITLKLLHNLLPQTVAVIGLSASAMQRLRAKFPHLTFAHHEPPQRLASNEIARRRARDFAVQTNARFTFIALGSPLQESLAYEIARQPSATGTGLCIGCALEFCAGTAPRAPGFMRHLGFEWLHRLICNPLRLWRRYLRDDPPILLWLIKQKFRQSPSDQPLQGAPAAISAPGPYPPARRAPLQKTPDEP